MPVSPARSALALVLTVATALPVAAASPRAGGGAARDPFPATGGGSASARHRLPDLVPTPRDAIRRAFEDGTLTEAEYALARARSLLHPRAAAARYGDVVVPARLDATLVLRDLAVRLASLHGEQLARARALLARPTDGPADPGGDGYSAPARFACSAHVCVTWVSTTDDAPDPVDTDGDTIPDWVEQTQKVAERVWRTEVNRLGYRPPKPDGSSAEHGPDGRLDVYIANLGDDGLYGYCTSDDPNLDPGSGYAYWDLSAYCVVDDDYRGFPLPGLPSLRVTLAHEFFHAVQFAYDAYEDAWFMEGTAAWIEDEVYDGVNDNRQYLWDSPLRRPAKPLDFGSATYLGWYGSWIFWRYLEESAGAASDPSIVRAAWRQADGSPGGRDRYSTAATAAALKLRGRTLRAAFAGFGSWNLNPDATYAEGAAYPHAPLAARYAVGRTRPRVARRTFRLDHLTTRYVRLRPGTNAGVDARIRVRVDGPDRARGPFARLVIERASGGLRYRTVALDAHGDGARTVRFGRGTIASVTLVLTNASVRFRCWHGTRYSCQGVPRDDDRPFAFDARLVA
jgi:hypothetical protein